MPITSEECPAEVCPVCHVATKTSQSRRSLPLPPLAASPVPPYPGLEPASSSSPVPLPSSLMQAPCDGPCLNATAS